MVRARTFFGRKSLTKCDENVIAYRIVHENISAILKRQIDCTKNSRSVQRHSNSSPYITYAFGQFKAYILLGRMSKMKKKPAARHN